MNMGEQSHQQLRRLWNIFAPELMRLPTFEDQILLIATDKGVGDAYRKYHNILRLQHIRSKKFFTDLQEDRRIRWQRCTLGIFEGDDFDQVPEILPPAPELVA